MIQSISQPHPLEQGVGLGLHLGQRTPGHSPREHHVLASIKLRHEVEGLEN